MQSLQDKASEWSGVAAGDAFAIDDANVFEALGGTTQPFVDLSTNFYTRVYEDEEEWFREIFSGSKKEDAIRNQYEFLVQRMGGPPLFSQRRGHPALIGRHRPFPVTHQAAERWLHHMQQAYCDDPGLEGLDHREQRWIRTAMGMRGGRTRVRSRRKVGEIVSEFYSNIRISLQAWVYIPATHAYKWPPRSTSPAHRALHVGMTLGQS